MTKKLFVAAKKDDIRRNVVAGGSFLPEYGYCYGFYSAAKLLVEYALDNKPKDALFYPICFNYRHYIELELKHLINTTERFYHILKEVNSTNRELEKSVESLLGSTHSLERLLNWLIERLGLVSSEQFDKDISKIIRQFHNMDPNGQIFRYPFKKNGNLSLADMQRYDIKNIQSQMEEVENYLSGIDMWLDDNIQLGLEFLQEIQDEISQLESDLYE